MRPSGTLEGLTLHRVDKSYYEAGCDGKWSCTYITLFYLSSTQSSLHHIHYIYKWIYIQSSCIPVSLWQDTSLVSVKFTLILLFVLFFILFCSSPSWPPLLLVFTSWSWQIFSNQCILGTVVMIAVSLCPTFRPDRKSANCLCFSVWLLLLPLLL